MAFSDIMRNIGSQQSDAMGSIWGKGPLAMESPWQGGGDSYENPFASLLGPFGQHLAGGSPWAGGPSLAAESPWSSNKLGGLQTPAPLTFARALAGLAHEKTPAQRQHEANLAKIKAATAAAATSGDAAGGTDPNVAVGANTVKEALEQAWGTSDWNDPGLRAAGVIALAESGWNPQAVGDQGRAGGIFQTRVDAHGGKVEDWFDVNKSANKWVPQLKSAAANLQSRGWDLNTQEGIWQLYGAVINPGVKGFSNPQGSAQWKNVDLARTKFEPMLKAIGTPGSTAPGESAQNPAPAGSGAPVQVNRTSQFGLGLNKNEADAFCGPAAALALAKFYGNNIPVEAVRQAAQKVGWSTAGMAGPQSQVNLLNSLGVQSQMSGWNDAQAQALIAQGKPVTIDSPAHYFVADQYDPRRGYRVGTSGTDLRQGSEWMTPQQMASIYINGLSAGPRSMIWKT